MASTLSLLADVGAFAAFDLTETWDLHDPRFGTAGSTEVTCPTCGMRGDVCMGHHASLPLGIHMFHPLLYKEAQQIINSVCSNCGRLLERLTKSKSKRCTDCNIVNHGDYVVYADDMSRAVRQNNNGAKNAGSVLLPDGYVVSSVLVPPIHLRTPEDMEWSTDIHKLYEQLLHAVRNLHNKKSAAPLAVNALGQSSAAVKQVCATYTKITGAQGREGIMGVLSGKEGIFRKIMLGKRVEMSARAVIVGDPSLQMDEVAVPRVVSDGVRVRVTCGSYNEEWLKDLASRGRLWWEGTEDEVSPFNVLPGMTFQRGMRNGDYVMLNRQPSLSRQSMTCYRVVLRESDSDVFGLNPQATPPFNADFDGDEMNTFFMSQTRSHQCIAEMTELCKMENVVPVQDLVTGCHIMSKDNLPVSDAVLQDCMCICKTYTMPEERTTRGILSMFGLAAGEVTKSTLTTKGLDLHKLQLVVERWMSTYGLTVQMSSIATGGLPRRRDETPDEYRERCVEKVVIDMSGTGLMHMINSGAKGTTTHATHMAVAIGQQYVGGREGIFCERPYSEGLTPDEFFGHQMAAREGVVSTGVHTAFTGYLNRRGCKVMADLKLQYNNTVADDYMLSSFNPIL